MDLLNLLISHSVDVHQMTNRVSVGPQCFPHKQSLQLGIQTSSFYAKKTIRNTSEAQKQEETTSTNYLEHCVGSVEGLLALTQLMSCNIDMLLSEQ